jgi:hypothetical protein
MGYEGKYDGHYAIERAPTLKDRINQNKAVVINHGERTSEMLYAQLCASCHGEKMEERIKCLVY